MTESVGVVPKDHLRRLRVIVVDDHAGVREGLRRLLTAQVDMEVVAEASNGPDALQSAQGLPSDIVLMDVSMPGWNGVTTTRKILEACPDVKVIAVSRYDDPSMVRGMLDAGARGYVLKQSVSTELIPALRAVAAGATYVDSTLQITSEPSGDTLNDQSRDGQLEADLTASEKRVLQLVATACSNQQIARTLSITADAAAALKTEAMRKAHLVTRIQVIGYAQRRGWLPAR